MAETIAYPPVSGSKGGMSFGTPLGPFPLSYADSGLSILEVSNGAGDHVSPNAFSKTSTRITGGVINGLYWDVYPYLNTSWSNYPSPIYDQRRESRYSTVPDGVDNKLFAVTSPDRAEILLPVFLSELRDIPAMIRHAGNLIKKIRRPSSLDPHKEAASQWIAYNFGWAPLVGDLKKIVNFSDLAAKREKEFDRLYSKSGLKRRVDLYSDESPASITYNTGIGAIDVLEGNKSVKVWGTVRYRPVPLSDSTFMSRPTPQYVKRAVLGLNAANITANIWEALPWSWFIDYFVNISDFLGAHPLGRTAVPDPACVMTHHQASLKSKGAQAVDSQQNITTCSAGYYTFDSKNRRVVYPSGITAALPNLSVKQLSILGSLAITGAIPRFR